MGKMQRRKGHAFERWVANQLKKIFPEARRHLEYQASEAIGVDVANTGKFKVQCKRGRKYSPLSAIKEIQICPFEGGVPVLVTQGDFEEPLAVLPFSEFLDLLNEAYRN